MYIGPCIAFFRVRVSRVRISKFSYRSADTDSKQKIWTALRGASPRAIAKILSLTADERQVSLLALINVPVPSPNRVNTQTAWASRWHESTVVLLRYAKYCFRSINDTINQNYRDKRYDTIIL